MTPFLHATCLEAYISILCMMQVFFWKQLLNPNCLNAIIVLLLYISNPTFGSVKKYVQYIKRLDFTLTSSWRWEVVQLHQNQTLISKAIAVLPQGFEPTSTKESFVVVTLSAKSSPSFLTTVSSAVINSPKVFLFPKYGPPAEHVRRTRILGIVLSSLIEMNL